MIRYRRSRNGKGGLLIKNIITTLLISVFVLTFSSTIVYAEKQENLQSLINQTETGETLRLSEGKYYGPVKLDKSITIVGEEGVQIIAKGTEPLVSIHSDGVQLKDLSLVDDRTGTDRITILVKSRNNQLRNISITTNGIGVKLEEAHENKISDISIQGNDIVSFGQRGNGIDLWGSHGNTIQNTTIQDVKDGIYIESSEDSFLLDNEVRRGRYGYHLMFTAYTRAIRNKASQSLSGMMVMGTKGTVIEENELFNNRRSVQSQGLLLYDVKEAHVSNNHMLDNKIGIYVEDAQNNQITKNKVENNFIGVQLKNASQNDIHENTIRTNVVQGQAEESAENNTNGNFWGDHQGIDTNRDGISDLTYIVDPYYLNLTEDYPPFQLFFQAPGLIFLEKLLHTPTENWLMDETPLMENPLPINQEKEERYSFVLIVSMALLGFSSMIIYLGGIRK